MRRYSMRVLFLLEAEEEQERPSEDRRETDITERNEEKPKRQTDTVRKECQQNDASSSSKLLHLVLLREGLFSHALLLLLFLSWDTTPLSFLREPCEFFVSPRLSLFSCSGQRTRTERKKEEKLRSPSPHKLRTRRANTSRKPSQRQLDRLTLLASSPTTFARYQ